MDLPCGKEQGKGIAFGCGEGWGAAPVNFQENPEPNPASKRIEMGRQSPLNDLSGFRYGVCRGLACFYPR